MPGQQKTVLCIEDDRDIIGLIGAILEREGIELVGALGGEEGLEKVRNLRPDLVLLDIMMPGVDGWEVHRRLKADAELRGIPVIAVTVLGHSPEAVHRLESSGMDDFVSKPFLPQDLVESVSGALEFSV
jgi:CheY-like chemotaxis protein